MMEGAAWRAILKVPLSRASPSPTYMLYSWAPDRGNKEALLAVAAALAKLVLLQPAANMAWLSETLDLHVLVAAKTK